jgi:hypothetical protein
MTQQWTTDQAEADGRERDILVVVITLRSKKNVSGALG